MKLFHILAAACMGCCLHTAAQNSNDVLMHVNGRPVSVGEFMYSYNKNGNIEGAVEHKTIPEYVDMFVNYKLKVAAAEAAHLDTLTSFRKEFLQYRDMQLTPYLVDEVYIDSVARGMYDRTVDRLKGQDMIRVAHILLGVSQQAEEKVEAQAKKRADSLCTVLHGGGDFAALATQYSTDRGTSVRGGELPWIGPGMTLREFETAAYALRPGEISAPIKSAVGYHIIKMLERKQLEPYDTLRAQIVEGLKRQGIEETAAEHRINTLVAQSGGRQTRETVLDSVLAVQVKDNDDLRYLVNEYHDGLLLYEISRKHIWDRLATDKEALNAIFRKNRKKYAWTEPHYRGFVVHMKDKALAKRVKRVLKKNSDGDWRSALGSEINTDSIIVRVSGPYLCRKGENNYIDHEAFGGPEVKPLTGFPYTAVFGQRMKQPKEWMDVKALVEADYQEQLEKEWVARLRATIPFSVDEKMVKQLAK